LVDGSLPAEESSVDKGVEFLELFFDLVFVYAVTQLAGFLAADTTPIGYLRSLVLFGLIWWGWSAYLWVTNLHDVASPRVAAWLLAAMGASFFVAFTLPGSFTDDAAAFAISYVVLRVIHLAMFVQVSDPAARAAVIRFGAPSMVALALLLVGAYVDAGPRLAVWFVAVVIDLSGPLIFRRLVDQIQVAPGHAAERYGLFVIVALGESIIATGVGAATQEDPEPLTVASMAASLLISAGLWWAYFARIYRDTSARLVAAGDKAARMVRESYSYLHVLLVAGIVLFAVGAELTVAHASEPLDSGSLIALCGGVALFLVGHLLFLRHMLGRTSVVRPMGAGLLAAVGVAAWTAGLPAAGVIWLVALVLVGVLVSEAWFGSSSSPTSSGRSLPGS
jgi:low temperature requirement protein LtrA